MSEYNRDEAGGPKYSPEEVRRRARLIVAGRADEVDDPFADIGDETEADAEPTAPTTPAPNPEP
jgi:hypothetical protein